MKYMDITGTEIERLYSFHKKHPDSVVRVSSDTMSSDGTVIKMVSILGTSFKEDIADKEL